MVPFFLDFAKPILSTLFKNETANIQQMMNQAIADLHLTEEDCAEMNGTVGRKDVTSFIGTLTSKSSKKGVFITTSTFSKEAYDSLNHLPSDVSVVLIDGITLANYMVEFNLGVTVKKVYEVKRIDSDYFEDGI